MRAALVVLALLLAAPASAAVTANYLASGTQKSTQSIGLSVSPTAGSTVIVAVQYDNSIGSTSLSFGSDAPTVYLQKASANSALDIYQFKPSSYAAGQSVLVSSPDVMGWVAVYIMELNGAGSVLKYASATASSNAPSSGATTTLVGPAMAVGFIGTAGPSGDTPPVWGNSFTVSSLSTNRLGTAGGTANQNATIALATKESGFNSTETASASGITSRWWEAAIIVWQEGAAQVPDAGSGSASQRSSPGSFRQRVRGRR